jgi:hypothetical protein
VCVPRISGLRRGGSVLMTASGPHRGFNASDVALMLFLAFSVGILSQAWGPAPQCWGKAAAVYCKDSPNQGSPALAPVIFPRPKSAKTRTGPEDFGVAHLRAGRAAGAGKGAIA